MKKYTILFLIVFLTAGIAANAQNKKGKSNDLGRIILNGYVSDQAESIPSIAKKMLKNKMNQIATKNGMGGSSLNPRFIITPNISVLTKDITPTAPPMIAITLDVTLYVGDGIEGTLFASESIEVKGVGTNETKAYIAAIKRIKPGAPAVQDCIRKGKEKIIEYYNSKCDFIIKEAQTLEGQQEYGAAILKLTSVPEVCLECFEKCMDAVAPIYQKQIDRECKINMEAAKNAWSTGQDANAAEEASKFLGKLDPNASCFSEAKSLSSKIAARIKELDQRDWDFKLKEQQDDVNIEKARIKGARDVGVAYGNNQPQEVITYNLSTWW